MNIIDLIPDAERSFDESGHLNSFIAIFQNAIDALKTSCVSRFSRKAIDAPEEVVGLLAANRGIELFEDMSLKDKRFMVHIAPEIFRYKGLMCVLRYWFWKLREKTFTVEYVYAKPIDYANDTSSRAYDPDDDFSATYIDTNNDCIVRSYDPDSDESEAFVKISGIADEDDISVMRYLWDKFMLPIKMGITTGVLGFLPEDIHVS